MPTIGGKECTEPKGSMTLKLGKDGAEGKRIFDCDWDDKITVMVALLGTYANAGDLVVGYTHPATFPPLTTLAAQQAHFEGFGTEGKDSDGNASYPQARIYVTYKPIESDSGDTEKERVLATERMEFNAELLEIPEQSFEWTEGTDNGKKVPQKVTITVPTIDHIITRHDLDKIPKDQISARLGAVNLGEFLGLDGETLLFLGASAEREITAQGSRPYTLSYTFRERFESWNKIWNVTDHNYLAVDPIPYVSWNMNALLDSEPEED